MVKALAACGELSPAILIGKAAGMAGKAAYPARLN
jgi:hypothetical protein